MASLVVATEPVSASRPRVSKWGTYYAKPYQNWLTAAKQMIPQGMLNSGKDEPLVAVVETVATRAKTSKLKFPRGDVDNYAKGPLDAITKVGGYYTDDNQIVLLLSHKRFAAQGEEPHTRIELYKL